MLLSVLVALAGLYPAFQAYHRRPGAPEALARRFPRVHHVLLHKYFVDEAYGATVVAGTMAGARGLWAMDRRVLDGAVHLTATVTKVTAWFSGLTDRSLVDGLVNAVGRLAGELSFTVRRLQSGLIQNYALVMLVGVFACVTLYLIAK